jgi:hypothetical protein
MEKEEMHKNFGREISMEVIIRETRIAVKIIVKKIFERKSVCVWE